MINHPLVASEEHPGVFIFFSFRISNRRTYEQTDRGHPRDVRRLQGGVDLMVEFSMIHGVSVVPRYYSFGFVLRHVDNRYVLRLTNRTKDTLFFLALSDHTKKVARGKGDDKGQLYICPCLVLTMHQTEGSTSSVVPSPGDTTLMSWIGVIP